MTHPAPTRPAFRRLVLPSLVGGFVIAVLMWAAWFVTHLPEVSLSTPATAGLLLGTLLGGAVLTGRWVGGSPASAGSVSRGSAWKVGLGAGLVSSLVNLMLLGAFLASPESVPEPVPVADAAVEPGDGGAEPDLAEGVSQDPASNDASADTSETSAADLGKDTPAAGDVNESIASATVPPFGKDTPAAGDVNGSDAAGTFRPDAPLIAAGFIATGLVVGAIGGLIGGRLRSREDGAGDPLEPQAWLFRFGVTAWAITLLLILIGGLVTSSESGLAVPDWPTSYGANMFLYPIGLMAHPRIFLEHAHRLFGSLTGLTTLVLAITILVNDRRGWVKIWAIALVALVILQGWMGGERVKDQSAMLGVVHGVLGQVFLALLAMQATWLSPLWVSIDAGSVRRIRRVKKFATALTHATVLQLAMGAAFRHLSAEGMKGASHALWTHVGFSIVVVVFATLAGAAAMGDPDEDEPRRRVLKLGGQGLIGIVMLQFALGWAALWAVTTASDRGPVPTATRLAEAEPVPMHEILLATAHQANGALLLTLAAVVMVWAKLGRKVPKPGG